MSCPFQRGRHGPVFSFLFLKRKGFEAIYFPLSSVLPCLALPLCVCLGIDRSSERRRRQRRRPKGLRLLILLDGATLCRALSHLHGMGLLCQNDCWLPSAWHSHRSDAAKLCRSSSCVWPDISLLLGFPSPLFSLSFSSLTAAIGI